MRKYTIEIKWGLIFMVVFLLWKGMENIMGLHGSRIGEQMKYTLLFGGAALLIYVLALLDKRKNFYNGRMTWQQGFLTGLVISVIIALFSPISQLIVHKVIAPSYFKNAIEYGISTGGNEDNLVRYYSMRTQIFRSFQETLSLGIVTSTIIALFVRK